MQSAKTTFVAGTLKFHKVDLSSGIKPQMPHKEYLTYGIFPLVLAGILALTHIANIPPFEEFNGDISATILNPLWLIKYFVFVFLVGFSGNLVGLLMTWIFKPMVDFLGIQVAVPDPEPEPNQPATRSERRAVRKKRNRGRT